MTHPYRDRSTGWSGRLCRLLLILFACRGSAAGGGTCLRSPELRREIKSHLTEKLRAKLERRAELREELKALDMPFHRGLLAFMPEEEVERALLDSKFVASLATSMGSWYEHLAVLIATKRFGRAEKVEIQGTMSEGAADTVSAIMRELDNRRSKPDYAAESQRLKHAVDHGDASKPRRVAITVDFFIPDADGIIFAAEMKTPRPNKSMVKGEKRKLLELRGLLFQKHPDRPANQIRTYLAFPYNPYRTRDAFDRQWTYGRKFVDLDNEALIGKEFWDYIGGEGTYEELIRLVEEVGKAMVGGVPGTK